MNKTNFDIAGGLLGIDFGTCNSSAAIGNGGRAQLVSVSWQHDHFDFPTVAYIGDKGNILTCHEARNSAEMDPGRFVEEFKLDLADESRLLEECSVTREDLVVAILKTIKAEAEIFNSGKALEKAVITVPAIYGASDKRRLVMRRAAERAGFAEVELLLEPESAAIYYMHQLNGSADRKAELTLVYDLGGGTFDPALMERTGDSWKLVPVSMPGVPCGGIWFDEKLMEHFREKIPLEYPEDPKNRYVVDLRIKTFCEKAKRLLSGKDVFEERDPITKQHLYKVTRAEFNGMIDPLLEETQTCCEQLLKRASKTWSDVGQVLLVGGSCNIPRVRSRLEERIRASGGERAKIYWRAVGSEPVQPEYAVCLGAALWKSELVKASGKTGETPQKVMQPQPGKEKGFCTHCGVANEDDARYCTVCGGALTSLCPECGRENPIARAFCPSCGTNIASFGSVAELIDEFTELFQQNAFSKAMALEAQLPPETHLQRDKGRALLVRARSMLQQSREADARRLVLYTNLCNALVGTTENGTDIDALLAEWRSMLPPDDAGTSEAEEMCDRVLCYKQESRLAGIEQTLSKFDCARAALDWAECRALSEEITRQFKSLEGVVHPRLHDTYTALALRVAALPATLEALDGKLCSESELSIGRLIAEKKIAEAESAIEQHSERWPRCSGLAALEERLELAQKEVTMHRVLSELAANLDKAAQSLADGNISTACQGVELVRCRLEVLDLPSEDSQLVLLHHSLVERKAEVSQKIEEWLACWRASLTHDVEEALRKQDIDGARLLLRSSMTQRSEDPCYDGLIETIEMAAIRMAQYAALQNITSSLVRTAKLVSAGCPGQASLALKQVRLALESSGDGWIDEYCESVKSVEARLKDLSSEVTSVFSAVSRDLEAIRTSWPAGDMDTVVHALQDAEQRDKESADVKEWWEKYNDYNGRLEAARKFCAKKRWRDVELLASGLFSECPGAGEPAELLIKAQKGIRRKRNAVICALVSVAVAVTAIYAGVRYQDARTAFTLAQRAVDNNEWVQAKKHIKDSMGLWSLEGQTDLAGRIEQQLEFDCAVKAAWRALDDKRIEEAMRQKDCAHRIVNGSTDQRRILADLGAELDRAVFYANVSEGMRALAPDEAYRELHDKHRDIESNLVDDKAGRMQRLEADIMARLSDWVAQGLASAKQKAELDDYAAAYAELERVRAGRVADKDYDSTLQAIQCKEVRYAIEMANGLAANNLYDAALEKLQSVYTKAACDPAFMSVLDAVRNAQVRYEIRTANELALNDRLEASLELLAASKRRGVLASEVDAQMRETIVLSQVVFRERLVSELLRQNYSNAQKLIDRFSGILGRKYETNASALQKEESLSAYLSALAELGVARAGERKDGLDLLLIANRGSTLRGDWKKYIVSEMDRWVSDLMTKKMYGMAIIVEQSAERFGGMKDEGRYKACLDGAAKAIGARVHFDISPEDVGDVLYASGLQEVIQRRYLAPMAQWTTLDGSVSTALCVTLKLEALHVDRERDVSIGTARYKSGIKRRDNPRYAPVAREYEEAKQSLDIYNQSGMAFAESMMGSYDDRRYQRYKAAYEALKGTPREIEEDVYSEEAYEIYDNRIKSTLRAMLTCSLRGASVGTPVQWGYCRTQKGREVVGDATRNVPVSVPTFEDRSSVMKALMVSIATDVDSDKDIPVLLQDALIGFVEDKIKTEHMDEMQRLDLLWCLRELWTSSGFVFKGEAAVRTALLSKLKVIQPETTDSLL
jgi:actin-like ATPase involved in cell morphogenesis